MACEQCKKDVETRPYGPGRTDICLVCAEGNPEWLAIAQMYAKEAMDKRRKEVMAGLQQAMPNVIFIEIPQAFVQSMLENAGPTPGCDCPACSAKKPAPKTVN